MEERENKNKFWKGVLVGALVTAFSGLTVVGMAAGIWTVARGVNVKQVQVTESTDAAQNGQEASGRKLDMTRIGTKLNYMQSLIDQYYLFEDENTEDPEEWIYTGFVYALQDPYSAYYNAEEYKILNEDSEGEYYGIGVQVSQNIKSGIITVVKVFKGSPAEKAGMLPGDIINKVDDILATGEDLSLLVKDHIKGPEGTTVPIQVFRESTEEYVDMDVERKKIETPTVEFDMLDGHVGYISVTAFDTITIKQFQGAIDMLESKGMKSLVVDLRNNGGGVVEAAKKMVDYILPDEKVIVSFKGKGVPDSTYYTEDGHQVDVPIVVLVNGESASASEVFTGALRDNDWATIVGTKTFGKGIAQGVFSMADGSALKLTTAYYYVPSGECIHEIGIEPDVNVELDKELRSMIEIPKDQDNQLRAAVEVLEEGVEAVNGRLAAESEAAAAAADEASKAEESSGADEVETTDETEEEKID